MAEQSRAEAERAAVTLELQRQVAQAAGARREALRGVLQAARLSVRGAKRGFEQGLGIAADVVDAKTRVDVARRDLAQPIHDALLARLRLLLVAGMSPVEAAADIDRAMSRTTARNAVGASR